MSIRTRSLLSLQRMRVGIAFILCLVAVATAPGQPPFETETYTYKQVGPLAIQADVCRLVGVSGPRPVLVLIHGGGLMSGNRQTYRKLFPLRDLMLADGGVVVWIDYRLAPETKLPGIVSDIEGALRWVREKGPELFDADPARIAVAGGSAGGYLALVAGHRVKPRPAVIVSYWGFGTLLSPRRTAPSENPDDYRNPVSREEAYRIVSGPPVANEAKSGGLRSAFIKYCRRNGIWLQEATGWDPKTEAAKFRPYEPLYNVSAEYPPTMLLHGRKDDNVPYHESEKMAAEMKKRGLTHRLILDPEGGHGGWEPAAMAAAHQSAIEFIRANLVPAKVQREAVSR